jgi:glycosyltransferase involved in cell wall biosynthesis
VTVVSILTPSIPERAHLLAECKLSVLAQTVVCWEHLVEVDERREGCARVVNRLAERATGDWLLIVADDDLLLPGCLETLLNHAAANPTADIIYAPPLVWGIPNPWWFFQEPPAIPSFALMRADVWRSLGGYDENLLREEDRDLWTKALAAGAVFSRADSKPTWTYRFHGGNKSLNAGIAA